MQKVKFAFNEFGRGTVAFPVITDASIFVISCTTKQFETIYDSDNDIYYFSCTAKRI